MVDVQSIYQIIGINLSGWVLKKIFDYGYELITTKHEKEKEEFDKVVDNILLKHHNVNLLRDHFVCLFRDEKVKENLLEFENGNNEISIDLLIKTFNKIVFSDDPEKITLSTKVITDLLDEMRVFIFNDLPSFAFYIDSILKIFRESTGIYAKTIIQALDMVNQKLDKLISDNEIKISQVMQLLTEMNQKITAKPEKLNEINDDEINKLIKVANKFLKEGKILSAREIYFDLLKKVKNDEKELVWKINSNIGKTFINEENEKEGIEYFKAAYEIYPNEEKGLLQLAYAKLIERNVEEGKIVIEKILSKNPSCEEVLVIKCNLFSTHDLFAEAIEAIQHTKLNNFQTLYTYGFVLFKAKKYEESKEQLLESLKYERSPMALDIIGGIMLEDVQDYLKQNRPLRLRKNSETYKKILEAQKYLDETIELYEKQQGKKLLAYALHNRGVLFSLLREKEKCMYDFKRSQELGLEDGLSYINIGIAYLHYADYRKANDCFNKALSMGENNALQFLINSFVLSNDMMKAKELILTKVTGLTDDLSENNIIYYLVLAEIYKRELDIDKSSNIMRILSEKFPQNLNILEREIQLLREAKQIDQAVEKLERYFKTNIRRDELLVYTLSELYFEKHKWDKSEKLLEELLDIEQYDYIQRNYLYSLFNQGKYQDALDFIEELQKSIHEPIEELIRIKAHVLFHFERFKEAKELYKTLSTNYQKVDDYYYWGLSEFRLGSFEKAVVILETALHKFQDRPKDLLRISVAYLIIGKTKEALKISYDALLKQPDDLETIKNYLMIFINHTQQNPKETIDNSMSLAYRNNLSNYKKLFPNDKSFQPIMMGENLEEVKELVRENEKQIKSIAELYDLHQIPLSIVTKLLGKNIYQTWVGYCNQQERKIWAYNNSNIQKEYQLLKDYRDEVVVEPIAFFTLFSIGKLEFFNRFTKCHFPQRLIDVLHSEITNLKMSSAKGMLTLFSVNGELFKNEIPASEVEKSINRIEKMIDFIRGKTFGYEIKTKPIEEEINITNELDEATNQAFQYALNRNVPLLIDESNLLEYFQTNNGVKGFSSLTLLNILKDENKISVLDYNEIILRLIATNYYFVPLSADIILQGLKQHNFQMSFPTQFLVKYLNQADINEISVAMVFADLFVGLYQEKISDFMLNNWIDYALDSLPQNKLNTTTLLKLIYDHTKTKYANMIEYDNVLKWIDFSMNTWAISRCVPYFK